MLKELEGLRGADRSLRAEALDTLVELARGGRDDATQALRGVVTGYREFDQEIYSRALNRLCVFGDGSLAEALQSALADADYGCQLWAAKACGELGIRAAEPLLIELLDHPEDLTREAACRALGQLQSVTAVEPLARLLDDPSEFIRAAASAGRRYRQRPALERLWTAFRSRRRRRAGHWAAALARLTPEVFHRLVQAARHDDPELRYWAARALGATGDERAFAVLTSLAADHATTPSGAAVSTAAKKALKTLHRIRARPAPPRRPAP